MAQPAPHRSEGRKARTRAALIAAAQAYAAEGNYTVPITEITNRANIGIGSFYNHFQTKEELFEAAAIAGLETLADVLDQVTEGVTDPAVIFAHRFRIAGRLHRVAPQLSKVLLNSGMSLLGADVGLWPRARRDIAAGVAAGRFTVDDVDLATTLIAGGLLGLGQLLHAQPERDDAASADRMTEDILRMLGLTPAQARRIAAMPLPDLTLVYPERPGG
jgi:AcrR family transcriptional regulator